MGYRSDVFGIILSEDEMLGIVDVPYTEIKFKEGDIVKIMDEEGAVLFFRINDIQRHESLMEAVSDCNDGAEYATSLIEMEVDGALEIHYPVFSVTVVPASPEEMEEEDDEARIKKMEDEYENQEVKGVPF